MTIPRSVCILDFESAGIKPRPNYPPKPCSFSYKEPAQKTKFVSFGHPCENNSTFTKGKKILLYLCDKYSMVFHNLKFDAEILEKFYGIRLKLTDAHCTQILAFLHNPYANTYELKKLTDDLFNMPPDEQDNLKDWILENVKGASASKKSPNYWAGLINLAPAKLVGVYANSDVDRTYKLFKFLWPRVIDKYKMMAPYQRELRLIPHLWRMEAAGVYVKPKQLKAGIKLAEHNQRIVDNKIRKRIGVKKTFDLDKKEPFADALQSAGKVESFIYTAGPKTGKLSRSVSKENLSAVINDDHLRHMLMVRSKLKTDLQTFLRPWLEIGQANGGALSTQFNSTRSSGFGAAEAGAKSGRIVSARPNFLNVPKTPKVPDGIPRKTQNLYGLLPKMRHFIWPDPGKILLARDYNSQEIRVMAHYEYGELYNAYLENPSLNIHEHARVMVSEMIGLNITRDQVKTLGFGIIYGMGIGLLAKMMNVSTGEAREIYDAYLTIFPGLKPLIKELKQLEKNNDYLTTWGGRVYYTEPPKMIKGRMRNFGYKMLNYLIQPSSADITKEAFIRASEAGLDTRIVLYDELICNADRKTYKEEMQTMLECMESVELDILLLTDGKHGRTSWGEMTKFPDKRKV